MCSRRNLQLLFQFSLFLKFILFCTLMTIGGLFVADKDLERAYGSTIVSHGVGLLMVRRHVGAQWLLLPALFAR